FAPAGFPLSGQGPVQRTDGRRMGAVGTRSDAAPRPAIRELATQPRGPPAGVSGVATKNPAQGIGFGRRLSGVPKSLGGPWLTVWEVRPRALSTLRCSLTRCKQMAPLTPVGRLAGAAQPPQSRGGPAPEAAVSGARGRHPVRVSLLPD